MLAWIDAIAARISEHRGARVSRADVIRWLTRRGRAQFKNAPTGTIASQV